MKVKQIKKIVSWLSIVAIASIVIFGLRQPATAQLEPKHYTELEFPPLPEVELPEYERYQLDNGMVVYLVEDRDLPLVKGTAIIRTGSRYEPSDKVGLASITGTLMRSGGTESHPAEELNLLLEQKAASVETGIGTTSGNASFNTLTEDLDTVFPLFAEIIRQPAFAPAKLNLAISQNKGQIARRNDDPDSIAEREFDKLVYGANSPYARTVEYQTLNNITREDVVNFYQQYIRPDSIILGIVGDFDSEAIKTKITEAFGDWNPTSELPPLEVPNATQEFSDGLFLVDRPQLTQSNVLIGHLGGKFKNPDYPVLSVLNGVLNGFGGRLFDEVRSRQGLAYSIYGYWNPNYDYDGTFVAGGQTQSNTTVPFIKSVLGEIEQLRTTPITEAELSNAKESILNSFVFNFQTPDATLSRLMRYEYFGYPEDFIFQYQDGVKNTTVEDIQRVAKEHLHPEKMVTLVVGNSQAIEPPLTSLNREIETVDISIPQPS
ncbi:pitrilysin family protein [Myxosarcina sp. GI1]|uniref:M16 family metallopeptidase n=1 Tax=Myxosarcina sp. GI1 TaxID=1541065 RepID=UPI0005660144|nr:pitrilysin family protein [Myxosarcina sp. GI1]